MKINENFFFPSIIMLLSLKVWQRKETFKQNQNYRNEEIKEFRKA
jgi:hypothetical protein